jgi:putative sterol carrier protein
MSLATVIDQIKQKFSYAASINARIKIDFGDDGVLLVDATENPPVITEGEEAANSDADTTLICSLDTFNGFISGSKDPNIAYMMGKLKVKGSMGVAMKLNAILED